MRRFAVPQKKSKSEEKSLPNVPPPEPHTPEKAPGPEGLQADNDAVEFDLPVGRSEGDSDVRLTPDDLGEGVDLPGLDLPEADGRPRPKSGVRVDEVIDIRITAWRLDDSPFSDDLAQAKRLLRQHPDMGLAKCRQTLERCLHELHAERIGNPGTKRLEQLIQDLGRAGVLPRKVLALAEVVRELGNVGVHPIFDAEGLTHREAQIALLSLLIVLEWYARSKGWTPPDDVEMFNMG
jgi:Domain of unknown function (DUF4145)